MTTVSSGPLALEAPADLLVEPLVRMALIEDLGRAGDITAQACIEPDARLRAAFVARRPGVIAGLGCVRLAMAALDPGVVYAPAARDGDRVEVGTTLAVVEGPARSILSAERVALNFLGHLSGVATLTAAYVAQTAGTRARIIDTRKTTPGLRILEKYAVRCGGGSNHRFGLDDAVLIKDNHVAACGGVGPALRRVRERAGHMVRVEVEVDGLDQLAEALEHAPDVIMLDNFAPEDMRRAVALAAGRVVLEASGGVSLATVREIALTGVDYISVGALTHSAPNFDIGLDAI